MKTTLHASFSERQIQNPFKARQDGKRPSSPKEELVPYISCSVKPNDFEGKEAEELNYFLKFACTPQFWECIHSLRPSISRLAPLTIIKNSDGDDPPDIEILVPGEKPIGVEITDFSPIASMIAKVGRRATGSHQIPGASDARTLHEIETFARNQSLVEPHRTSFLAEQKAIVSHLSQKIQEKDVPGNDIILLVKAFSGDWPESKWAAESKSLADPKHVQRLVILGPSAARII